jgi:hypothetical protein
VRQDDGGEDEGVEVDLPQEVRPFDLLDRLVSSDGVNLENDSVYFLNSFTN